ncbi:MAG TPA: DinB family protein, partial [Burkholderiales bacterium]|nr:DinB family protein [Burkholderiales bacterium]
MQAARTIADTPPRRLTTTSSAGTLIRRLRAARSRTLAFASDLTGAQHRGPQLATVNPPLWEIAHLGWFQEYWCLRYRDGNDFAPSLIPAVDALYNSALVAHGTRWTLPLLPFDAMLSFLDEVLTRVLDRLEHAPEDLTLRYFAELAAAHEEMHCEAFTCTRQTLGYPAPRDVRKIVQGGAHTGDVTMPGGEYSLGAPPG